jgi:hypothetical protein
MPYFTGLGLGIWPWPIVNLILSVVYSVRSTSLVTQAKVEAAQKPFENLEYYKVVRDENGEIVGIEIHRKVVPVVQST